MTRQALEKQVSELLVIGNRMATYCYRLAHADEPIIRNLPPEHREKLRQLVREWDAVADVIEAEVK